MSFLGQEFKARGTAQVIVFLRASGGAKAGRGDPGRLQQHFVRSELGRSMALAASVGARAVPAMRFFANLGVMLGTVDRIGLAALRADAGVHSVSGAPLLSPIRPHRVAAAKLEAKLTWGIQAMNVPALWDQGFTGEGVLVGHLDTGVDGKHPALKGAVAHFAEFDRLGRAVKPAPGPWDSEDHGTHTAGTIAGRPVNGRHIGIAPQASLASAIVIEGGDAVARVLAGMDWSLGLGARVLSMSLGFRGWWPDFLVLTRVLRRKGMLPVFAVGNEEAGSSRSPGNYPEALSVGACDTKGRVPDFSSSQRFTRKKDPIVPDVVAPGDDVVSARPGGGYQTMDGSSMATPHVAGLAALLFQARPKAAVAQVERAIFASCSRPAGMTEARGGRGIPDARKALAAL